MNKHKIVWVLFIIFTGFAFQGCLSVETKEYTFKLKNGNSGEGKVKYINIMRSDDSLGTIESDYNDLVDSYLNGNKPEDELLGVKNVKKRMFEEDNKLCGEMTFEFDDITKLKFFNYNNVTWAYYISAGAFGMFSGSETFFSSNGTFAGDLFPVVFWDGDQKKFELKTALTQPSEKTKSLLDTWKQKGGK